MSEGLFIEFPLHDIKPQASDFFPDICPRCKEKVSSVCSIEFGRVDDGGWHQGRLKRGPVGVCRSKPPVVFAVIAPDGRISCATLLENAIDKSLS